MFKKIAIPLDGSSFAERVLAHLSRFGAPQDVELVLIRAVEADRYFPYVAPDAVHMIDLGKWQHEAEGYLKRKANELRENGYRVTTIVTEGDVALALCSVAEAQDADLIAMTTHGRSGLQRWIMGSVAERIVRQAHLPVYLVRPGHEADSREIQRILLPLDGSFLAEDALSTAAKMTTSGDMEFWLVQAIEMPEVWGEEFVSAETIATLPSLEEQETLAYEYLGDVAEGLRGKGFRVQVRVSVGHPVNVISDTVNAEDIDLVVMSTHGRSGISRWVFGSVAEKVLQTVEAPMLITRAGSKVKDEEATDSKKVGTVSS